MKTGAAAASSAPSSDGSPPALRPRPARVLLTNDDGPRSPFFSAWVEHVRRSLSWRAFAAPPAEGQSFVSKAVATGTNYGSGKKKEKETEKEETGKTEREKNKKSGSGSNSGKGIFVTRVDEETVHVSGPPATAVNLSLHHLATDCELVVSGPNIGHNVGRGSVLSSGTVGAALEGAVAGKKAIALSFPFKNGYGNWSDEELRRAIEASGQVVRWLWENWGPGVDFYNVNVPLDFARGDESGGGGGGGGGEDGGGGTTAEATENTTATMIPLEGSLRFRVVATTVDPRAQYSSLYTAALPGAEHDFEWGPSGLRVFEPAASQAASQASSAAQEEQAGGKKTPSSSSSSSFHPGGDVEAVSRGHISVTPLRAALAHAEHDF